MINADTFLFVPGFAAGAQRLECHLAGIRFIVTDNHSKRRTGSVGLFHLRFKAATTAVEKHIDPLIAQSFRNTADRESWHRRKS